MGPLEPETIQAFSDESKPAFLDEPKPTFLDEPEPEFTDESKPTFIVTKTHEHHDELRDGVIIEAASSSDEEHKKTLSCSSSSASSSSSGSPFEIDVTDNIRLSANEVASPNINDCDSFLGYETPGHETNPSYTSSSNNESPTQSPPKQTMTESNVPPGYRIPSSVFARKSSVPGDWSVASNESLFSIHMGNMSFTRDHLSWFKSGELGLLGDPMMPPPLMDYSSNQYYNPRPPEFGQHNDAHFGVTESKAAETMREVIQENEAVNAIVNNKEKENRRDTRHSASFRNSDASGASVKSFAFPILMDHKHDSSRKQQGVSHQFSRPHTPKVVREHEMQRRSRPETSRQEYHTEHSRWFCCFPCCSSCS